MRDDGFLEFLRDQLRGLEGELEFRRMFGARGLYRDGVFFGILMDGRIYLKTSEVTRGQYISRGMGPFRPSERQTLKTYYEVPAEVVESPDELTEWSRRACAAERDGQTRGKRSKKRRNAARKRAG